MKTSTLAAILERDLLRTEVPIKTETPTCFACGRSTLHRLTDGDDNSRFCSIGQGKHGTVGEAQMRAVRRGYSELAQGAARPAFGLEQQGAT
jgi:hypothetical protein